MTDSGYYSENAVLAIENEGKGQKKDEGQCSMEGGPLVHGGRIPNPAHESKGKRR